MLYRVLLYAPMLLVHAWLSAPCRAAEPVAYVGDTPITEEDLAQTRGNLPRNLQSSSREWLLQTLVNRELLLQEARRRGLDTSAVVQAELRRAADARLRDMLFEREVADVSITAADLRQAFESGPFSGRLEALVAQIVLDSRTRADSVRELIQAGTDFATLARAHSLDPRTAPHGGRIGYWREGEMAGPMASVVEDLETGQVSEPIQGPDGRHYLLSVLERRPVGYEEQEDFIENRVKAAKIRMERAAFMDSLLSAYAVHVDTTTLSLLLRRGSHAGPDRIPPLAAEDSARVLVRSRAGDIDLREYLQWLQAVDSPHRRPLPWHREQVRRIARTRTVTSSLYPAEARRRGIHQEPAFRRWRASKQADLMLDALRREAVASQVITPDRIAAYYRAHRDAFRLPDRTRVEGVLAMSAEQAEWLRRAAADGQDFSRLARRVDGPANTPTYWAFDFALDPEDTRSPGIPAVLVQAARSVQNWSAPAVVPIPENDDGVHAVVLRFLKRLPARTRPLQDPQVRETIRRKLEKELADEIDEAFESFVAALRERHADEIRLVESGRGVPE